MQLSPYNSPILFFGHRVGRYSVTPVTLISEAQDLDRFKRPKKRTNSICHRLILGSNKRQGFTCTIPVKREVLSTLYNRMYVDYKNTSIFSLSDATHGGLLTTHARALHLALSRTVNVWNKIYWTWWSFSLPIQPQPLWCVGHYRWTRAAWDEKFAWHFYI